MPGGRGRGRSGSAEGLPESADGDSGAPSPARNILPGEPFEPVPASFGHGHDPLMPSGWGAGGPGFDDRAPLTWGADPSTSPLTGGGGASPGADPLDALQHYAGLPLGAGYGAAPAPDPSQVYQGYGSAPADGGFAGGGIFSGAHPADEHQPTAFVPQPSRPADGPVTDHGNPHGAAPSYGGSGAAPAYGHPASAPNAYGGQPFEPQPFEPQPFEPQHFEPQPFGGQPSEGQPAEGQPFEGQPFGGQSFQPQSFEPQSFQPQSFPPQSFQPQSFQPQTFEPQSFGQQAAAPQGFAPQGFGQQPFGGQPSQPEAPHGSHPFPTAPTGAFTYPGIDQSSVGQLPGGSAEPLDVTPASTGAHGSPFDDADADTGADDGDGGSSRSRRRRRPSGRRGRGSAHRSSDVEQRPDLGLDAFTGAAAARKGGSRRAIAGLGILAVLGAAGFVGYTQLSGTDADLAMGAPVPATKAAPAAARYLLPTSLGAATQIAPAQAKELTSSWTALAKLTLPDLPPPLVVSAYAPTGAKPSVNVVVYGPGAQSQATFQALIGSLSRPIEGSTATLAKAAPSGAAGGELMCGSQVGTAPSAWCAFRSVKGVGFVHVTGTVEPDDAASYARELRAYSEH